MLRNLKSTLKQHAEEKPGQSLVEFAFVGIILFGMLMGIMDAGRLLFTYSAVSNAAQEGTHFAIIRPRDVFVAADATQEAANATRTPTALRVKYIPQQVVSDASCNAFTKS